ncbi:MAG: DUF167 domain-containing protein [Burkholderiales bacterium]|nr:DUF167 domain-containing protein [Burkholderiales bacterium]
MRVDRPPIPAAVTLTLHAQPGATRTEYAGPYGDAHKIRLAAPPVDGRANEALIAFLAEAFGVRPRDVAIVGGAAARRKIVRISAPAQRPPWL